MRAFVYKNKDYGELPDGFPIDNKVNIYKEISISIEDKRSLRDK